MQGTMIDFIIKQIVNDERAREKIKNAIDKIVKIDIQLNKIEEELIYIRESLDLLLREKRNTNIEKQKRILNKINNNENI